MTNISEQQPARRLGTWAAIAMVVSEVVGVGIFLAPATMMRTLGSPALVVAVWMAMAGLTVAGALSYAELATRFPRAGGAYVFLREGFGLRCAAVYGWLALLVMDPALMAVLGIGLARYLVAAFGSSPDMVGPLAMVAIAGFGLMTLLGARASTRVMNGTAAIKLLAVALLVLSGLWSALIHGGGGGWSGAMVSTAPREGSAAAIMAAFFAFGGWWELGKMSEEVKSPRRTIPRAFLGGVALVTATYALVTLAFMLVMDGAGTAASDEAFVRAVGTAVFGPAGAALLPAMVVVAVCGTLAAVLLRVPRGYLAMARDGVFPRRLASFDQRRGTSPAATLLQTTLACLMVLLGTFGQILAYFVPATLFFVGLSAAAALRLPRPDDDPAVFHMPAYPWPTLAFLVLVAAMLVVVAAGSPQETLVGALAVGLGLGIARVTISDPRARAPRRAPPHRLPSRRAEVAVSQTLAASGRD